MLDCYCNLQQPPSARAMMPGCWEVDSDLITNDKLEELLAASPSERVTPEYMKSRIADGVRCGFHRARTELSAALGVAIGETKRFFPHDFARSSLARI
jgi:hypothetical protein